MDEREKLRKFRELDDAFAQALRELEGLGRKPHSPPTQPSERSSFEERLNMLMEEYALSRSCVHEMLSTLVQFKKIS
nr:hypothetical protein [Salinicola peritrichatus]